MKHKHLFKMSDRVSKMMKCKRLKFWVSEKRIIEVYIDNQSLFVIVYIFNQRLNIRPFQQWVQHLFACLAQNWCTCFIKNTSKLIILKGAQENKRFEKAFQNWQIWFSNFIGQNFPGNEASDILCQIKVHFRRMRSSHLKLGHHGSFEL